jgi:uncharacterized protein (TIGR03437 family)
LRRSKALHLVLLAAIAAAPMHVNATSTTANSPQLSYATYIGWPAISVPQKQGGTTMGGMATDASGFVYVTGRGSDGTTGCNFVTKVNQAGNSAVWSVCLGTDVLMTPKTVAIDPAGRIYVASDNYSLGGTGNNITKLTPETGQTVYSTSVTGMSAGNLAVDSAGNAYVVGVAFAGFQPTPGGYVSAGGAALVKLAPGGAAAYATYLDLLKPFGVAVDSKGQPWAIGTFCYDSSGNPSGVAANCAVPPSPINNTSAVRKLDATASHLLASMNFSGSGGHFVTCVVQPTGIAVAPDDSAWIVGTTEDRTTLPTTPNALQPVGSPTCGSGQGGIGYAIKLSPSGTLLYGTYLGTNQPSQLDLTIPSVVVDGQGRPYFALDAPFPGPINVTPSKIMGLSADGATLLVSTSSLFAQVQNMAVDRNGGLYVAGNTGIGAFLTTPGAWQTLFPNPTVWYPQGFAARFDLTTEAPTAQFYSVLNSASYGASVFSGLGYGWIYGFVAPGELVTLFGSSLPSNPKITFDGRQAPILYADAKQINTVVPFEVEGDSTVVTIEGVRSYVLPLHPAVPGLFTSDGSGMGQIAALNEDGTVNSVANPAKPGSVVAVYMTGAGAMSPSLSDGQLGPLSPPFPAPVQGMSALVGGNAAHIEFAGQAPGLIAGCIQVNIRIPPETPSGNVTLAVYMRLYATQAGSIAVQ